MVCLPDVNSSDDDDRSILLGLLDAFEHPARAGALAPTPRVIAVARHHRLSPLLSAMCGTSLPPPLAETFRRDRVMTTARAMVLGHVAEECIAALAASGISTIVLKGLEYERRLYGGPGLRPTGDVDLMVPGEHRRAAFAVLNELGFEPRPAAPGFDEPDYHEVAWQRAGVEVDLHLGLAPRARCRIDYAAVWAEREPLLLSGVETSVLAQTHAALFQALHMTIDHFAVPAIYLVDLSKLVDGPDALAPVQALAARWGCRRPLATALALTAAFLPDWGGRMPVPMSRIASRVVHAFGTTRPLPRREQLLRKLAHFDRPGQAAKYLAIQARRNVREKILGNILERSARERLRLGVE